MAMPMLGRTGSVCPATVNGSRNASEIRSAAAWPEDGLVVVEEHTELVPSEACRGVGGPHGPSQALGRVHEKLVTGGVPPRVVDDLEVVEIEEEDGRPGVLVGPAQSVDRRGHPLREEHAVRQSGERVVEGLMPQLLLERRQLLEGLLQPTVLQHHGGVTAEGGEHRDVLGAERRRLAGAVTDDHEPDDVALRGEHADHRVPQTARREHALEVRLEWPVRDGQRDEARDPDRLDREGVGIRHPDGAHQTLVVSSPGAPHRGLPRARGKQQDLGVLRAKQPPRGAEELPRATLERGGAIGLAEGCGKLLELSLLGTLDAVPVHGHRTRRGGGHEQDHGERIAVVQADHRGNRHQAEGGPHGPGHQGMAPRRARRVVRSRHLHRIGVVRPIR